MNSAELCKSFDFNIYRFNKYHSTDCTKTPACKHYFGCLIKGTAKIKSKQEYLDLSPGDIFYIPKGLKYQSQWFCDESGKNEFFSFGFEIAPTSKHYILQKIKSTEKLQGIWNELCEEFPFREKSIGILYHFFGEAAESMIQREYALSNAVIDRALEYIYEEPNSKMSEIAKSCNISESGLYLLFKKHHDKTPNEVRLDVLCKKASEMLTTTDLSIQDISDQLGFSSTSYFRKVLYKYTQKTPKEIRKSSMNI